MHSSSNLWHGVLFPYCKNTVEVEGKKEEISTESPLKAKTHVFVKQIHFCVQLCNSTNCRLETSQRKFKKGEW